VGRRKGKAFEVEQGLKLTGVLLHSITIFNHDIDLGRATFGAFFYVNMGGATLRRRFDVNIGRAT
jgi:hypothetical protein